MHPKLDLSTLKIASGGKRLSVGRVVIPEQMFPHRLRAALASPRDRQLASAAFSWTLRKNRRLRSNVLTINLRRGQSEANVGR